LKIQNIYRLCLGVVACLGLLACNSNSSDQAAAGPESYEYKGASDPLVATPGADRAGELAARFALIQGRQ